MDKIKPRGRPPMADPAKKRDKIVRVCVSASELERIQQAIPENLSPTVRDILLDHVDGIEKAS